MKHWNEYKTYNRGNPSLILTSYLNIDQYLIIKKIEYFDLTKFKKIIDSLSTDESQWRKKLQEKKFESVIKSEEQIHHKWNI